MIVVSSDSQGPAVRAFWGAINQGELPNLISLLKNYPDETSQILDAAHGLMRLLETEQVEFSG